jgi:hypothetical protein
LDTAVEPRMLRTRTFEVSDEPTFSSASTGVTRIE